MKVRITLLEEMLGMSPGSKEILGEYIAANAPDAASMKEEIEAIGEAAVMEKQTTVFPRMEDGAPCLWDYQVKGYCKDACGMLRRAPGTKSAALKAYKMAIDGLIFISPRKIRLCLPEGAQIGRCERALRASGPMGVRTALACSETVPAGTTFEFWIRALSPSLKPVIAEWFDYGQLRGWGQWRNSGKGIATWSVLDDSDDFPTTIGGLAGKEMK